MAEHEEKEKKPIYKKWWFWLIIVVIIIAIVGGTQGGNGDNANASTSSNNFETLDNTKITLEEFNRIETGMTYEQVTDIIGGEGTVLSEADITGNPEYKTTIYTWEGSGSLGANANVTFQGGKVVSKAQFGLK